MVVVSTDELKPHGVLLRRRHSRTIRDGGAPRLLDQPSSSHALEGLRQYFDIQSGGQKLECWSYKVVAQTSSEAGSLFRCPRSRPPGKHLPSGRLAGSSCSRTKQSTADKDERNSVGTSG